MRTCNLCDNKHYGRGYCRAHYLRWYKHGDPNILKIGHRYAEIDILARLNQRSVQRGDCLLYEFGRPSRSGHRAIGYQGRRVGVHRVAWILKHGLIPDDLGVLHYCDTPNCINPDHLFLGTPGDNNADRDRKGRHRALPGSKNGYAKLSEHQVLEIRQLLARGATQRAVAAQFGVGQCTIWAIANRRRWTHVPEAS